MENDDCWHQLRALVASSPALRSRSMNPANEQLLFHGTNRYCQLADDGSKVRLCSLSACHLCCIIRNSFDICQCGECCCCNLICWYSSNVYSLQQVQNINFVALGRGYILHPALQVKFDPFCALVRFLNPHTEADDYTLNGDSSCKYRVLLVSRVVVGNPHKRRQNATNMIEPPCGYHSVGLLMSLLFKPQCSNS